MKEAERTGLKVSEARIGVRTNSPHLIEKNRFFWLDTNFFSVDAIPYEQAKDSFVDIRDEKGTLPSVDSNMEIDGDSLRMRGPFSSLEKQARDPRYSLFGNLGIFSSWILRTLEIKHRIYTFHACALEKEDRLLVVLGGAGAGKTVFLLSSLHAGWRLFSTEFVHFRVGDVVEFFKGPVKDPVRVDTLQNFFPWVVDEIGVDLEATVGGKTLVDLSTYQTEVDVLTDPDVLLVIPHVEEVRNCIIEKKTEDQEYLLTTLFLNASDKIGKSTLLYGRFAVPGVDSPHLAQKRTENIKKILAKRVIKKSIIWVSGVADVEGFFDRWE